MASLQEPNGSYRILFCYHGKLHTFTIGKVGKDEAENKARPPGPRRRSPAAGRGR